MPALSGCQPKSVRLLDRPDTTNRGDEPGQMGSLLGTYSVVPEIDDAGFDDAVLGSSLPVLVHFCAGWTDLSRKMDALLEDAAVSYEGRVVFYDLDVDLNPASTAKYGIESLPTLLIFKNGKVAARQVGVLNWSGLRFFIDRYTS